MRDDQEIVRQLAKCLCAKAQIVLPDRRLKDDWSKIPRRVVLRIDPTDAQDLLSWKRKVPAVKGDVNQSPDVQRTCENCKTVCCPITQEARRQSLPIFCGSCVRILYKRAVLQTKTTVLFSFSNPVAIPYRQEKEFKRV